MNIQQNSIEIIVLPQQIQQKTVVSHKNLKPRLALEVKIAPVMTQAVQSEYKSENELP